MLYVRAVEETPEPLGSAVLGDPLISKERQRYNAQGPFYAHLLQVKDMSEMEAESSRW